MGETHVHERGSPHRFGVAFFCFLLGLLNYLDRVVIGYSVEPIKAEFGLDDATFGLLMSAFAVGTLLINGVAGWLLDKLRVRSVWSVSIFWWSLAMASLGIIDIFWIFLAMRFVLGLGEGVNFPAMNRALTDWMPPQELGRALTVGLLGVPLALLVGGPILSHMIVGIGWRWSFVSLGLLGLVLGVVFVLLYRDTAVTEEPVASSASKTSETPESREPRSNRATHRLHRIQRAKVRQLLKDPTLLATAWSFFAFGYVLFFGVSWLPGYLQQTWHVKLTTIGWFAAAPWGVSIVLMIAVGWLSDVVHAKTGDLRKSRIHVIWICQLIAVFCFLPLVFTESLTFAVIFLSLAVGFSMAPNAPYYSVCAELYPERAGLATGVIVTFFSASGIVSPLLTGWLADVFGNFGGAFAALCVVVVTSVFGLVVFARPRAANGAVPRGDAA